MLIAFHWRQFTALGLLSTLLCGGCAKKEDLRLELQPVQGKVLVDGKPAARAMLTFHPESPLVDAQGRSLLPTAVTDAKGEFRPSTYAAGDGLPVGKFAVTVTWPKIIVEQGEEQQGPDQLRSRYNNPKLPAQSITIQSGENKIAEFRLQSS